MLPRRRVVPAGAPAASENDEMDVGQPEQVILDPNAMAKAAGGTYFELGSWMVRLATLSALYALSATAKSSADVCQDHGTLVSSTYYPPGS